MKEGSAIRRLGRRSSALSPFTNQQGTVNHVYIDRILYPEHSQVRHSVFRNTVCSNRENGYVYGTYSFKTKFTKYVVNNEMKQLPSITCDILLTDAILYR
jgi:hypothetical protein